jgi:hypothetical protein
VDNGVAHSDGKSQNEEPGQRGFFSRAWHAVF